MKQSQIKQYLADKENEKGMHLAVLRYMRRLDESVGLSKETMREITAKLSSKVASCDISIRDHKKLLGTWKKE